jgi:hypothetical protein
MLKSTHISNVGIVCSKRLDERPFPRLFVSSPDFDSVIDRGGKDPGSVIIGVNNAYTVIVARVELRDLLHDELNKVITSSMEVLRQTSRSSGQARNAKTGLTH